VIDVLAYVFCLATLGQTAFAKKGSDRAEADIRQVGERSYEIRRATVDATFSMSNISRSARIVPEIHDGKAVGFRLFSVQPDGPLAKMGLQSGDRVVAANGVPIGSPEQALQAYTRGKKDNRVRLQVERNGQRLLYEYRIR
jgi:type II secretory pathway component PulC